MKALPSVAFGQFRGSAGDVTARVSKERQILSPVQCTIILPLLPRLPEGILLLQFLAVTKTHPAQMAGWAVLAEMLKGSVVF